MDYGKTRVAFPVRFLEYDVEEREAWRTASHNNGTSGFGEEYAAQFYRSLGYAAIVKGFNIFGGNRPDKWPETRQVLMSYYGEDRFLLAQQIRPVFEHVIEPDLLVYQPDGSELFFVEVKRTDTYDKLHPKQVRALALLTALLDTHVEIAVLSPKGSTRVPKLEEWELPFHGN